MSAKNLIFSWLNPQTFSITVKTSLRCSWTKNVAHMVSFPMGKNLGRRRLEDNFGKKWHSLPHSPLSVNTCSTE